MNISFRCYIQEMWFRHKEEIEYWEKKNPDCKFDEYFRQFRWWLRTEYRKNNRIDDENCN